MEQGYGYGTHRHQAACNKYQKTHAPRPRMSLIQRMFRLRSYYKAIVDPRFFIVRLPTPGNPTGERAFFDAKVVTGASPILDEFIRKGCGDIFLHPGADKLNPANFGMLMEYIYTKGVNNFDGELEDWADLKRMAALFKMNDLEKFCTNKILEWAKVKPVIDLEVKQKSSLQEKIRAEIVVELNHDVKDNGMLEARCEVMDKMVNTIKNEMLAKHKDELMEIVMEKWSRDAAKRLINKFQGGGVFEDLMEEM